MARDVLLVEDDPDMREILVEFCGLVQWTAHPVGTIAEARAALAALRPDLAVVDWTLPDGNGGDVVTLLEGAAPRCEIVLATGHGTRVTSGLEGRVAAVLRKPYALNELAALFRAHDSRA